MTAYNVNPQ